MYSINYFGKQWKQQVSESGLPLILETTYEFTSLKVHVNANFREALDIKIVKILQGSVLCPLLLLAVMQAVSSQIYK